MSAVTFVIIFTAVALISAIVLVYAILTRPAEPLVKLNEEEQAAYDEEMSDNTVLIGYSTIGAFGGIIGAAISLYVHKK